MPTGSRARHREHKEHANQTDGGRHDRSLPIVLLNPGRLVWGYVRLDWRSSANFKLCP
ncbi:MAG TPA: hypothetical protein VMP10_01135 [Chloroflexota bacterium]|nr:hypothetical protein [Chloroflexota bacterium]